ncbi:hypothetical protein AB0N09_21775 [Streptomyces erythrochromogenes]|uniref:hypothetical protein n=1 Tax=Streptomyces erythrochromogenes TaxID=285574 RepID=UPI0034437F3F
MKALGWEAVPVTVVSLTTAAEVLRAEEDENTERKPLTPYEASRARQRRARVLAPAAKERKAKAIKERDHAGRAIPTSGKLPEEAKRAERETRTAAAVGTGYGARTLDKVDKIRDAAERGVIRKGKTETPVPEPVQQVAKGPPRTGTAAALFRN